MTGKSELQGMTREEKVHYALARRAVAGVSAKDIAEEVGVAAGTVRSWFSRYQTPQTGDDFYHRIEEAVPQAAEEYQAIIAKIASYVEQKEAKLLDGLYAAAEEALTMLRNTMAKHGVDGNRDNAAWIRSLVGALKITIEKARQMHGQPESTREMIVTSQVPRRDESLWEERQFGDVDTSGR